MSLASQTRRSVVLKRRPRGSPRREDFAIREDPVPALAPGEVVTRTIFLWIDPYMRGRISDRKSYATPVQPSEVMTGETIGEVVASGDSGFASGDVVLGARGWQAHIISPAERLTKLDRPDRRFDLSRRARDARHHRVFRHHRYRPAEEARNGGDLGRFGRGRLGCWTACQACRRAGCRYRRGCGEMPVRAGRTGVRRLHRSPVDGPERRNWKCRARTASTSLRECRRARAGGSVRAAQSVRSGDHVRDGGRSPTKPNSPPGPNLGFVVGKRVLIQGMIVSDKPERFAEWRKLATRW